MAPCWLKFYQFLVLYIEKNTFLKFFYYVPDFVRFQNRVILDLYGVPFHAMVVVGSEHDFSINSTSAYCAQLSWMNPQKKDISNFTISLVLYYAKHQKKLNRRCRISWWFIQESDSFMYTMYLYVEIPIIFFLIES